PAGRELDALVCEHVMGWTFRPAHPLPQVPGSPRSVMPDAWYDAEGYCRSCAQGPWVAFSTDIAAAWQGVKKIATRPRSFRIERDNGYGAAPAWEVIIHEFSHRQVHAWADPDEDLPVAICRAALLLVLEREGPQT